MCKIILFGKYVVENEFRKNKYFKFVNLIIFFRYKKLNGNK